MDSQQIHTNHCFRRYAINN